MKLSERLARKSEQETAAQIRDAADWLRLAADHAERGDRQAATAMLDKARRPSGVLARCAHPQESYPLRLERCA